jgi:hypothetical protein
VACCSTLRSKNKQNGNAKRQRRYEKDLKMVALSFEGVRVLAPEFFARRRQLFILQGSMRYFWCGEFQDVGDVPTGIYGLRQVYAPILFRS